MKVSKKELRGIIRECVTKLLTEAQTKIDNFDLIANLLEFNSPDDFYFVQIIKRWKDNQDPVAKQQGIANGTYHGRAWYLKSWRIRSVQDLYNLKPTIIQWCEQNNARAYITINSRSENDTNSYIKIYQQQYPSTDARYIKADDIIPGQAKSGPAWRDQRLRLFLDIDCKQDTVINDLNVWNETLSMLQKYNIKTLGQYVTPSGGLHIILANKNNRNLAYFKKEAEKFDNYINKGRQALVHANEDGKLILYSNVVTNGY